MRETNLFDEIARTLASPMPRRRALGRILGTLAVAAVPGMLWTSSALAQGKRCRTNAQCPAGQRCCSGTICCPNDQICCGSGTNTLCCPPGFVCDNARCRAKRSGE